MKNLKMHKQNLINFQQFSIINLLFEIIMKKFMNIHFLIFILLNF